MDEWLTITSVFEWQRGMLAQLAARLRARQGLGGEGGPGGVVVGEDGETIMIDDNCTVSPRLSSSTSPCS